MRERPRTPDELEKFCGIERTEPRRPTRADVTKLTAKRLRGPFWPKRKR